MQPWQERVIEEKRELDERLERLKDFLHCAEFEDLPLAEQYLLIEQSSTMMMYSRVLKRRIARFEETDHAD